MIILYNFRKELQEERYQQQSDVHTINIGIGSNYYIFVPDIFNAFFNIKGCLQKIELIVLINNLLGLAVRVERLTAQTEHRLSGNVTALSD